MILQLERKRTFMLFRLRAPAVTRFPFKRPMVLYNDAIEEKRQVSWFDEFVPLPDWLMEDYVV